MSGCSPKLSTSLPRRQLEDALAASERKYRDLYDNSPAMYMSGYPADHIIRDCNLTLARTLGYTREELIGQPNSIVLTPGSYRRMLAVLPNYAASRRVRQLRSAAAAQGWYRPRRLDVRPARPCHGGSPCLQSCHPARYHRAQTGRSSDRGSAGPRKRAGRTQVALCVDGIPRVSQPAGSDSLDHRNAGAAVGRDGQSENRRSAEPHPANRCSGSPRSRRICSS